MDVLKIGVRALASFIALLICTRIAGKRFISQGTTFEFIFALILGDLVDDFIFGDVPSSQFLVGVIALLAIDLGARFLTYRSNRLLSLVDGKPSMVFKEGQENVKAMRAELLSKSDIAALLRNKGYDKEGYTKVRFAVMEVSGEVSVLRTEGSKPLSKRYKKLLAKK